MTISIFGAVAIRGRFDGFTTKLLLTFGLVALGDQVFGGGGLGAATSAFAASWLLAVWLARPAARFSGGAMLAAAFACALLPVLFVDPSGLSVILFWVAISVFTLTPRVAGVEDAWRWGQRLALLACAQFVAPALDVRRVAKTRARRGRGLDFSKVAALLALPAFGTAVFIALFAFANPIVADWLRRWSAEVSFPSVSPARVGVWVLLALAVWSAMRPDRSIRLRPILSKGAARRMPSGVSVASVTLSLVLFNLIFAVENVLDAAFLWSRAELPDGVTLADYAHRGAYPLIATALLAGAFVLVALRPDWPLAESRRLRALVYVWIAQNVFLVASSALRTLDYVDAYSLTKLRIAALIWMALVALGLGLICWRLFRRKSGAWLINANAAALVATLAICATVDLGEIAATWNVRHNAATTGGASALDVAYLYSLGPSALEAMIEFERDHPETALAMDVAASRRALTSRLAAAQSDWRSWTLRGARRLAAAEAASAEADANRSAYR